MNVLFVASDNNYTSGAFLSMVKLNQLLVSEYRVNTFVVLPNNGDGESLLQEAGIPYEVVPSRNWVVDIEGEKTVENERAKEEELESNSKAVVRICELIAEEKIDILHINTSYSYVGAEAALKMHVPFIWHIREFLEEDQNRKIWNREKGYKLMRKATAVVAISNSIYKKYAQIIPRDKLHLIYNGIDDKVFANKEKRIFMGELIKIGIIGGVVPHKGQEELLQACGYLKREGFSDFEVSIIGKGREAYEKSLKEIVQNSGIEKNVNFLGPRNDIPTVLKQLDIVCVCSKNEAFGRITVEGMMAGCLVIGADTAGTREVLQGGKCGYLYEQGNIIDLAKKIVHVIENKKEAEEVRVMGQNEALLLYTAERNAGDIYSLYTKTVTQRF